MTGPTYRYNHTTERMEAPEIIGYDTSKDASQPSCRCAACAESEGSDGGSPLYAGDEWGQHDGCCELCGDRLDLTLVD